MLSSFKVDFPEDPLAGSFVHEILKKDLLQELVKEIKSLSTWIKLTKNIQRTHSFKPGQTFVFEVKVVSYKDHVVLEVRSSSFAYHELFKVYDFDVKKRINNYLLFITSYYYSL